MEGLGIQTTGMDILSFTRANETKSLVVGRPSFFLCRFGMQKRTQPVSREGEVKEGGVGSKPQRKV